MEDREEPADPFPTRPGGMPWWLVVVLGVGVCLLLTCGGAGYVVYRGLNVIVETYQPDSQPNLDGVLVDVDVRPQTRIKDRWGDQLVGPPYEFMFHIRDSSGRMTRARLHAARLGAELGEDIQVPVTNGINSAQQGSVLLYARHEGEPLARRVNLYAEIEVFWSDGASVRQEVKFLLSRGSRATLNIP